MNTELPFAEACERNKEPILDALLQELPVQGRALEIGSGTGQHLVWFAPRLSGLVWQPSDRKEYLEGLNARLRLENAGNILPVLELDVLDAWPEQQYDVVYSSNTAHIMSWEAVCAMFAGVGERLLPGGVFCLYGPFNVNGEYTAESNAEFDVHLRQRDPDMGLRDIAALDTLAHRHNMMLRGRRQLPANNQLLIFRKNVE
jgi:SAM-dependent methyltransferase